ncbi:MAG: hypothetical protein L3J96_08165 [Thermoplasmata archaeon]|nr:hypothetical protein [Thermoplasmata archaeon]
MTNEVRTAPSAWLALLVFADGFFVVLFALRDYSAWAVLGAVLAGLPLAGSIWSRRWDLPWFGPAAGLLLSFGLAAVQGFPSDSIGDAVLGGVLLGSPLAIMAAILRWSREPAVLVPATFAGLVDLLTLNAALNRLGTEGALATPSALANTFVQVSGDQLTGFTGLLAGNASVVLPVQSLRDPVFAALALLAIVGVFLALFAPERGPEQIARTGPSGILVPVAVAVAAAALFELAADRAPRFALLGLAVVVLGTVVAILVLVRTKSSAPHRDPGSSGPADRRAKREPMPAQPVPP